MYLQYHFVFENNYTIIYHLQKGTAQGTWKELVTNNTEPATYQALSLEKHWHLVESSAQTLPMEGMNQETLASHTLAEESGTSPREAYLPTTYREVAEEANYLGGGTEAGAETPIIINHKDGVGQ